MRSEREHQRDSEHQSTDHRGASSLLCQTDRFAPYMPKLNDASLGKVGERPLWVSDPAACRPLAGWPLSAPLARRRAFLRRSPNLTESGRLVPSAGTAPFAPYRIL